MAYLMSKQTRIPRRWNSTAHRAEIEGSASSGGVTNELVMEELDVVSRPALHGFWKEENNHYKYFNNEEVHPWRRSLT